jgi:hypothetical protein
MRSKNKSILFREVLECFVRFPTRSDTLRGIVERWLVENRVFWVVSEVQAALDELVVKKIVNARRAADGQTHYRFNPAARGRVDALLEEKQSTSKR